MTLFSAIVFSVFTSAMFFIKGQFFSGSGSTDLLSYFSNAPYICILVIPALCYKKPVSIYDDFIPASRIKKLISNYLKILLEYTILILFMLPVCLTLNYFGDTDPGQIFTGLICLIFYGAAVISLCLFINELFTNSILSFVISALLLALFNSIHIVPLYLNLNSFLSAVCRTLSFAWHFDAASKGIIDTRDILWLSLCAALFIYLAYLAIEIKKGRKFKRLQKLFYSGIIFLAIILLLNSTRYYKRFDFSKNKSYSVNSYTKKLAESLDDELKITYYRSGSLYKLYPQIRDVTDFINSYSLLSPRIRYTIKDPDKDSSVNELLLNYGITSQQLQKSGTNSTEFINVYSAIILEYKGNVQLIPFIMSSQTLEYDFDMRVRNLISGQSFAVNIIIGNGMQLYDDYGFVIPWLNSQGIVANPLFIEDPAFITNLKLCTGPLLVIGDSQINIENAIAIESYILEQKGNALFALSPYSCTIEDEWSITANKGTNLVEMLENWGVTFTDSIAADISCARITMYSEDGESENPFELSSQQKEVLNYPQWISLLPQQYCSLGMTLFWPVCLELSQNAVPYLITSPSAWTYKTDRASPSRLIETNPFLIQQDSAQNHTGGTQIIGAQITGELTGLYNYASCPDSNIIVIPDQYFVNTLMTGYIGGDFGDYRNFEFLSNCILKLQGEPELAALQSKTTRDTSLYKVSDLELFKKLRTRVYIIVFLLIPLILAGIYIWLHFAEIPLVFILHRGKND